MDEPAGNWRRDGESMTWSSKVRLTLTTHSAGGFTDNDFQMARRIDGLDG